MSTVNRSEVKSASFWLDALEGVVTGKSDALSKLGNGAKTVVGWITDGLDAAPRSPLPPPPPAPKPAAAAPPPPPPATSSPATSSPATAASTPSSAPAAGKVSTEELVADLLRWEGNVGHMYLCTAGKVTVGIGNMIPNAEAAKKLPWIDAATGKPATPAQIEAAFAKVDGMTTGMNAGKYASATTLRLPADTIRQLAADRLNKEFLPALRRQFAGFDNYPPSVQKALVDMVYNLGVGGLGKFKKLEAACEAGDWALAAAECNRKTSRPERNEWTRQMFLQAAAE